MDRADLAPQLRDMKRGLLCLSLLGAAVIPNPFLRAGAAEPGRALVRHAPAISGSIDGSVQQLLGENIALGGNASVTGDFFVPGSPSVRLNGAPRFGGTIDGAGVAAPSDYQIVLSGGASLRHVVRRTDAVALPRLAPPVTPRGTRRVTLTGAGQSPGDFGTLRDLTLEGRAGTVSLPPGNYGEVTVNGSNVLRLGADGAKEPSVYFFQRITLGGTARLEVAGPVVVTTGTCALGTNGSLGSALHPEWLTLNVYAEDVELNGSGEFFGRLVAPDSAVAIGGRSRLVGGLACDRLAIAGGGSLQLVAPPANEPPQIALTSPISGAAFFAPAAITLAATATDADGSVARVEFFRGTTKLGESMAAPYRWALSPLEAGAYTFSARAIDDRGTATDSAAVAITVVGNRPPVVSLTAPLDGTTLTAPAALALQAAASDPDGVVARVEFLRDQTKLGEDLFPPYETALSGLPAGTYSFTARAFDGFGASADSAPATVFVREPNRPPIVTLVAPPGGTVFTAPASFTLLATASDPDGAIGTVEFYQGGARLGEDATAPFEFAVSGLAAGSYAFSARALDSGGAATTSAAIGITVLAPNVPPVVTLNLPAAGAIFSAPASILLSAAASDPDGRIARVEFFNGATRLGEAASEPFEFSWSNVPPGTYLLFARAHDNAGAGTSSATREVIVRNPLPAFVGFEEADGFILGPVHGQAGWTASGPATVSDTASVRGQRSLLLAPQVPVARAGQVFAAPAGQSVVFVDLFVKPAPGRDPAASVLLRTDSPRVAAVLAGPVGEFYIFDGNGAGGGAWTATGCTFPLAPTGEAAGWQRLTLREDFALRRWDFYVDARLVAADLGFGEIAAAAFTRFEVLGHESIPIVVDDFYAGFENPLFTDADRDGMDDAWELRHGLDPTTNDRNRDQDGDGLTSIAEFRAGTSPADFFNGLAPQIEPLNGDGPGPDGDLALLVLRPDGTPWVNAPATFQITSGDRRISAVRGGPDFATSVEVRTDANGVARVYLEELEP